jgi:hypothetical protein
MSEFLQRGGVVSASTKRAAFAALEGVPLAEEPFVLAAVDALVKNEPAEAQRLLAEARRRKPRSALTRLLLLDRYLRAGDINNAAGEISALSGLLPQANEVLVGELARLAQDPKTSKALETALQRNPQFRDPLLERLASNKVNPDLILSFARSVPKSRRTPGPAAWEGKLLGVLVERNEVGRAYDLWRTFSAPNAPETKAGIYDERFQGLPGTAPFNWDFPASPAGVAERTKDRMLQVEYYGRDNAELASQLLLLPPGPYRLSVRVEGDAEGQGSKLSWKIGCHPGNARLLDLVMAKVSYSPRVLAGNFTVPAGGCAAQWLKLVGTAGEFPKAQHVTISGIRLEAGTS